MTQLSQLEECYDMLPEGLKRLAFGLAIFCVLIHGASICPAVIKRIIYGIDSEYIQW